MVDPLMVEFGEKSSTIRDLFEHGKRRKAVVGEENVYDFSLGNPSVPPPREVGEALQEIISREAPMAVHGYTSSVGDNAARDAIAADLNKRFRTTYSRDNLYMVCGAASALASVLKALLCPGHDKIVGIAPYFPEYERFTTGLGGVFKAVPPKTDDFQIDLEALEALVDERTQAVIVNSPNNPSGVVYTSRTLRALAGVLEAKKRRYGHPVYLISDEPYRELVYDGLQVPFVPLLYPDTIVCYSYSKSLSLPGDRIGYVLIPSEAEDFQRLYWAVAGAARSMGYVCAPAIMQRVIARCAGVRPSIESYDRNRRLLYGALTEMGYEACHPDGAFYLFLKAPGGMGSREFSDLARSLDLLLVPGDDFGCPGYLRVSYCVDHSMIERSLPAFRKLIGLAGRLA